MSPDDRREHLRRKSRISTLKVDYGLTEACYAAMLEAQNGVCAICGQAERGRRLAVDHCHTTGKVRALLCGFCNPSLGLMGDDSARLRAAADYIDRYK
jgi:hypothetical protein